MVRAFAMLFLLKIACVIIVPSKNEVFVSSVERKEGGSGPPNKEFMKKILWQSLREYVIDPT